MKGAQDLLAEHREALSKGRGLGGDIVGPGGDHEVRPLGGALGEAGEDGDRFIADDLERAVNLKLLDVLGEVPRGHPFVDVLVAGEVVEFLDTGLHVVTGDALAFVDGSEVDLVFDRLVSRDGFVRDIETEGLLGLHDGDPKVTFEDDAAFGGPDVADLGGGVSFGEDVWDHSGRENRKWGIWNSKPPVQKRSRLPRGVKDGLIVVEFVFFNPAWR